MQIIQFWLNNKQFNEAVKKLGKKSELYGFAKEAFLSKLKEVKELKKEVWFECSSCHKIYTQTVRAEIETNTGRLIPRCETCGTNLVRRIKKIAN